MNQENLERKKYSIVPYDQNWVIKFQSIKDMFENIFKSKAIKIEHVGSTSIPDMKAKPLIDVLIVVENIKDLEKEIKAAESLNYILRENVLVDRSLLFEKIDQGKKIENIHVLENGTPKIDQFINMRDYLRTHPEDVKAYENLKEDLYKKFPNDYEAYRDGKHSFLEGIEKLANKWVKNIK